MIEGSCHCGAVRYTVDAAPETVTDCNCSVCRRLGVLWAYYNPAVVTVAAAPGSIGQYVRENGHLGFHHCLTCGCTTHWRSLDPERDRMGVNARLMDPQVLAGARVRKLDGADTWRYLDEPTPDGA